MESNYRQVEFYEAVNEFSIRKNTGEIDWKTLRDVLVTAFGTTVEDMGVENFIAMLLNQ